MQTSEGETLSLVSKSILTGTELSLDIGVYCLLKKLLNRFTLSKKISLLSTTSAGTSLIFLPFTNVFKITQYVLGAVFGTLSLLARGSEHLKI